MIITDMNDDLNRLNRVLSKKEGTGVKARWSGWEIVKFTPNEIAEFSPKGVFHDGTYGFQKTYQVSPDGKWYV